LILGTASFGQRSSIFFTNFRLSVLDRTKVFKSLSL
jgi:hypothetical protein